MNTPAAIRCGVLAVAWAMATLTIGQSISPVDSLYPESPAAVESQAGTSGQSQAQAEEIIDKLQNQIDIIETRLGKATRPPSLAHNVERRLSDLEKRVQKLEQQWNQMQKLEQRIRRLEMNQPG